MEETTTNQENDTTTEVEKHSPNRAWIYPLLCWAISLATGPFLKDMGALMNLLILIGQVALLAGSLFIGTAVLFNKQGIYSKKDKVHATIGLSITVTTVILVVIVFIFH